MLIKYGPLAGETMELTRERYTIGRGDDCDIRIDDESVSTHHCSLVRNDLGVYTIIDEESTNGTEVNGKTITSQSLTVDSALSLGSIEMGYKIPSVARVPGSALPVPHHFPMAHRVSKGNRRRCFHSSLSIAALLCVAVTIVALVIPRSPDALAATRDVGPRGAALSVEGLPLGDDYPYLSPLSVASSSDGSQIFTSLHTGMEFRMIHAETGRIVSSIALGGAPHDVALDEGRDRIFVTLGLDAGEVKVINRHNGNVLFTLQAGHTPVAPVVSADGRYLFVCNRFDNNVAVYDLESQQLETLIPVTREPVAAARAGNGNILVVANHLPAQPANSRHVAAKVDMIDMSNREVVASILLPNGSVNIRDVCVSPDGRYAYVTHNVSRFTLPTTQLERGWMNTSALSIIDVQQLELLTTVLLDDVDLGAANPWGVACSLDGKNLFVAHSGTSELSVIDREGLHERITRLAAGETVNQVSRTLDDVPNDLSFLLGLRRRINLPGEGPRGVAVNSGGVVVAQYFSDDLAEIRITSEGEPRMRTISLGDHAEISQVRRGEMAFFDARLCFQNWQSCASCHPDARADALNWDLLNDGIGNPKNTRTMLYTHATPPVMITGIRERAEVAVRAGFRFIQFTVVPEETAVAVDEYLKALRPVPSPYLEDGELSEAARRGKAIFEAANCANCHNGEYYTNNRKYDVGIGPDELGIREFVTPMLVEVWRTAPYLFDGRAATMRDVLTRYNLDDKHGVTSTLSEQQIDDLEKYLLSL